MRFFHTLLLALASAALLCVPAADAASFKRCGKVTLDGMGKAGYRAKNLSCAKARNVLRSNSASLCFDNQIPGWTKKWRALPNGGRALTLVKGAKAIKTDACSPG